MSNQKEIAEQVLNYRLTGKCKDAKLKKFVDDHFGVSRFEVADKFLASAKPKAKAKKKTAKKK